MAELKPYLNFNCCPLASDECLESLRYFGIEHPRIRSYKANNVMELWLFDEDKDKFINKILNNEDELQRFKFVVFLYLF